MLMCLVHNLFSGAQASIWDGGCWKSQKERNGAPLIDCFNLSCCFVLCYGEEVPYVKMEETEADVTVNSIHRWRAIYHCWFRYIRNFLLLYLQLQWFCEYIILYCEFCCDLFPCALSLLNHSKTVSGLRSKLYSQIICS